MDVWLRRVIRAVGDLVPNCRRHEKAVPTSTDYQVIDLETATSTRYDGWHERSVADRQDVAYRGLIREMYAGRPRADLLVAAEALRRTGLGCPFILEVGCGSGYYSEILPYLLRRPVRYVGLDYSEAMICLARARYPDHPFLVGDATSLPFADGTFDVVLNGVSLMHILRYEAAIAESRRVGRRWCIFHTVPVLQHRKTTVLRKVAYGRSTIEVVVNEDELNTLLAQAGLAVRYVLDSIPYNLQAVLNEPTVTKTYVCEATEC